MRYDDERHAVWLLQMIARGTIAELSFGEVEEHRRNDPGAIIPTRIGIVSPRWIEEARGFLERIGA